MTRCDDGPKNFVIDWIEVRVTLGGPTQPQHVRNRIKRQLPHWGRPPYIDPETEASSRSSATIKFRVQNPSTPTAFMREVQAVARPDDKATLTEQDIEIIGIEIALDVYSHANDREALIDMALHMHRHHARPPAATSRITKHRTREQAENPANVRLAIAAGQTLNAGEPALNARPGLPARPGADYCARYYFKTTDTTNGTAYALLPTEQHRARMEVTLKGTVLPFTTIAGWRCFRFETLAPYFAMRRVTPSSAPAELSGLADLLSNRVTQHGTPLCPEKIRAHRKTTKGRTKADSAWNEEMRVRLRALTRSQK